MGRLLDEDAVIKVLELWQKAFRENSHYVSASDLSLVVKDVKELPTAQPEPHEGHWIEGKIYRDVIECNCSECGQLMTTAASVRMNYCPNCGAKMKGERQK